MAEPTPDRLERRKQRTRTALIHAAMALLAAGRVNAPILEITQAADVGLGSFYNHFATKEELFEAAVDEVLDSHGELLDHITASLDDPAEKFARSFRITGRLLGLRPQLTPTLLINGLKQISADRGLGPRGLRDINDAVSAGRFRVDDPKLAMAVAAGALMGLGQLLQDEPSRDAGLAADRVTEDLLCMFGLPAEAAHEMCQHPLPDINGLTSPGSAA